MKIACDLFWKNLKMYTVPDWVLLELKQDHPDVEILKVNCGDTAGWKNVGKIQGEEHLKDCEIYWGNRITEFIIKHMPKLKWIQLGSSGYARILNDSFKSRNILVTNSKYIMSDSVAIHAVTMLLALSRQLYRCIQNPKMDRSQFDQYFESIGSVINQRAMIVGFGDIGQRIANLLSRFGMKIVGVRRNSFDSQFEIIKPYQVLSELGSVDFVINVLPSSDETDGFWDITKFSEMIPTSYFIQVGHGKTVKELDLVTALKEGLIQGAGIDTYETNQLQPNSELLKLNNVILTPHIACVSPDYWRNECDLFNNNLYRYKNYLLLKNQINL